MAKPKQFPERIALHLADGTLTRLAAAAQEAGISVPALLRCFVEYGLTTREMKSSPPRFNLAAQVRTLGADSLLPPERPKGRR